MSARPPPSVRKTAASVHRSEGTAPMTSRKPVRILPPVEYLRECFSYNRKSGVLRWKTRPRSHFATLRGWQIWNPKNAGKIAGALHGKGYRQVKVGPEIYLAHRVIWKFVTGREPPATLDHKHGDRLNNAWRELRAATFHEQAWNSRGHTDTESGFRGVSRARKRWVAVITTNGVRRYLGIFDTPDEASAVYEAAARRLHGEFYRS